MATNDDKTEPKKTTPPAAGKTDAQHAKTTSTSGSAQDGGQSQDPNAGVRQQVSDAHEARVTVPGASNVDARLDNRTGADRPPVEQWPAKPQQIDGPDVVHQVEFTRQVLADRDTDNEAGDRKGMFSPGPHGLSDESLREGGPVGKTETLYGTEGLTEGEMTLGEPKADN